MTQDSRGRTVAGLYAAADIAGVSYQTINNWAANGAIDFGTDGDVLRELNDRKDGRKHKRYFYVDELSKLARRDPGPGYVPLPEAADTLGVSVRTVHRLCERQEIPIHVGTHNKLYIRRTDLAAQKDGVTYFRRKPATEKKKRRRKPRTKAS